MNSHSLMERLRNYGQQMANEYGLYISAMSDLESYSYDTAMFHKRKFDGLEQGLIILGIDYDLYFAYCEEASEDAVEKIEIMGEYFPVDWKIRGTRQSLEQSFSS